MCFRGVPVHDGQLRSAGLNFYWLAHEYIRLCICINFCGAMVVEVQMHGVDVCGRRQG